MAVVKMSMLLSNIASGCSECSDFDGSCYTFTQLDNLITNLGYVPIASAQEILDTIAAPNADMGAGTCWDDNYSVSGDQKFVLVKNIDMSAITWNASKNILDGFEFDGGGLTIDGLNGAASLFAGDGLGSIQKFRNLTMTNVNISSAANNLGALTTRIRGGEAINVSVNGSVISTGNITSGIFGVDRVTTAPLLIKDCEFDGIVTGATFTGGVISYARGTAANPVTVQGNKFSGTVTGGTSAGGILGQAEDSTVIIENTTDGDVISTANNAGLIFGRANLNCVIKDNKGTGNIETATGRAGGIGGLTVGAGITLEDNIAIPTYSGSTAQRGGIIGLSVSGTPTDTDSYWDTDISGLLVSVVGTGQTTVALQTPIGPTGIYAGWTNPLLNFGTATDYPDIPFAPACS